MHLTEPSSPRMAKSTSLGVLEKDGDMYIVDKDDILGLTQDVKNFSDGLGRLKELFNEQFGKLTNNFAFCCVFFINLISPQHKTLTI